MNTTCDTDMLKKWRDPCRKTRMLRVWRKLNMTYKIIGDSCLDLTEEMKRDSRFQMVPLTLQVGSAQVVDDETFDQKKFLGLVKADVYKRQAVFRFICRQRD